MPILAAVRPRDAHQGRRLPLPARVSLAADVTDRAMK